MFAESGVILVIFIPLRVQRQYNITVRSAGRTYLYEFTQILDVLKSEVLRKIQTILLNRGYAACPVGSL